MATVTSIVWISCFAFPHPIGSAKPLSVFPVSDEKRKAITDAPALEMGVI